MKKNLGITKILFFLTNPKNPNNLYELINEYTNIEGIKEPMEIIFSNIKDLSFREKRKEYIKGFEIIELIKNNCGKIKASDLITNNNLNIITKKKYLCTLISGGIKIRALFKVEMCIVKKLLYI